jgi:hypothetical protein
VADEPQRQFSMERSNAVIDAVNVATDLFKPSGAENMVAFITMILQFLEMAPPDTREDIAAAIVMSIQQRSTEPFTRACGFVIFDNDDGS